MAKVEKVYFLPFQTCDYYQKLINYYLLCDAVIQGNNIYAA